MNDMITRAQSAGLAPARLRVAVPQLQKPGFAAARSTHTMQASQQANPPRAVVAIGLASVIIAGCVYTGTELVLELLQRAPLIAAPTDAVRYISQVNEVAPPVLLALGVVVALACVPLVLVVGRRARREAAASARLAEDVAAVAAAGPAPDRAAPVTPATVSPAHPASPSSSSSSSSSSGASTTGSRHRATVTARPVTGIAPDRFTAEKALADALAYETLRPTRLTDPPTTP